MTDTQNSLPSIYTGELSNILTCNLIHGCHDYLHTSSYAYLSVLVRWFKHLKPLALPGLGFSNLLDWPGVDSFAALPFRFNLLSTENLRWSASQGFGVNPANYTRARREIANLPPSQQKTEQPSKHGRVVQPSADYLLQVSKFVARRSREGSLGVQTRVKCNTPTAYAFSGHRQTREADSPRRRRSGCRLLRECRFSFAHSAWLSPKLGAPLLCFRSALPSLYLMTLQSRRRRLVPPRSPCCQWLPLAPIHQLQHKVSCIQQLLIL